MNDYFFKTNVSGGEKCEYVSLKTIFNIFYLVNLNFFSTHNNHGNQRLTSFQFHCFDFKNDNFTLSIRLLD